MGSTVPDVLFTSDLSEVFGFWECSLLPSVNFSMASSMRSSVLILGWGQVSFSGFPLHLFGDAFILIRGYVSGSPRSATTGLWTENPSMMSSPSFGFSVNLFVGVLHVLKGPNGEGGLLAPWAFFQWRVGELSSFVDGGVCSSP